MKANFVKLMLGLAMTSGCIVEVTFEPLGGDVSVDGQWTIDGATPSAANCAAAGITDVELRIYETIGSDFYTDATLREPCSVGAFTTGPFLLADTYRLQWVAYNGVNEVARSTFSTVTANPGDTIVSDADFEGGIVEDNTTIDGSWTINGEIPTVDNDPRELLQRRGRFLAEHGLHVQLRERRLRRSRHR